MTGHKMLLVTSHFALELHGTAQNIPIEILGNGHRAFFELRGRLICFFYPPKSIVPDWNNIGPTG